jgi:MoaA/NifB/PqqE/SkfB family radical SAM enzyme
MFEANEIKHIHLELSSLCNARCPQCTRNFYGYPYNLGYTETNLSLTQLQTSLPVVIIGQLDEVLINGNYGDFMMNPESIEIISWLREINPNMKIHISTNGGARDAKFWQQLAQLNLEISFCIDGLEDTHHIYRQDTTYQQVIKNAKTYINAGGRAGWTMTEFEYNFHQIEEAKQRANELNFCFFNLRSSGRNTGPVYNRQGQKISKLGGIDYNLPDKINEELVEKIHQKNKLSIPVSTEIKNISCEAKENKSIYINSAGLIKPCCYLGLGQTIPQYDSKTLQLDHVRDIDTAISLFKEIEKTFNSTQQLRACQSSCSK